MEEKKKIEISDKELKKILEQKRLKAFPKSIIEKMEKDIDKLMLWIKFITSKKINNKIYLKEENNARNFCSR